MSMSANKVAKVRVVSNAVLVPFAREGAMTIIINRRSCMVLPKFVGWERRAIATCRCWTVLS